MLKVLEGLLHEKLENKPVKFLDTEVEKRLEIMKKLLVQNSGVDSLEFQDIDRKDLNFLNENEVFNQMYSNIQQKVVNEAISALNLPTEGESEKQSGDKNGVNTSVL
ncbi:putative E3 ubiquitin-protein ligase hulA [Bienertia sinuspersici]